MFSFRREGGRVAILGGPRILHVLDTDKLSAFILINALNNQGKMNYETDQN
jgi:hypothetical protein